MNQYVKGRDTVPLTTILGKPDYYDSPEGQNPWEKIWGLSKYAVLAGGFAGTCDCMFITSTRNVLETVNCLSFWMVPLIGLSTAFSSVTYIATNIRGKDDKINYACGALACGPVLHAWKQSTSFTSWGVAILMAAALFKKDSKQKNWEFMPEIKHRYGNYAYDFSLVSNEWPRRPL